MLHIVHKGEIIAEVHSLDPVTIYHHWLLHIPTKSVMPCGHRYIRSVGSGIQVGFHLRCHLQAKSIPLKEVEMIYTD